MNTIKHRALHCLTCFIAMLLLTACATTPTNEKDPFEPINRQFFEFNMALDEAILKPVAKGYREVVPDLARQGIGNFFGNLDDAYSFANNVLQLKPTNAGQDFIRVAFNTAFGFGGLLDIAGSLGIEKQGQDFGLTLAHYGVPSGPYLMLPFLGPRTVRDASDVVALWYVSPIFYISDNGWVQTGLYYVSAVDSRSRLLDTEEVLDSILIDRYQQIRDAYLQNRAYRAGEAIDYGLDDYFDPDEDFDPVVDDAVVGNNEPPITTASTSDPLSNEAEVEANLETDNLIDVSVDMERDGSSAIKDSDEEVPPVPVEGEIGPTLL